MTLHVRVRPHRGIVIVAALALVAGLMTPAAAYPRPGATDRVSVASDGIQGQGDAYGHAISGDGRYVAFDSHADNLVPGDTNDAPDVFVHDRQTGVTDRVSVASDGSEANGASFYAAISGDGRHVAYTSNAPNLVPEKTHSLQDVFVHDRDTGTTERVSVASDGAQGNGSSFDPVISADGRHVAFTTRATNLAGAPDHPGRAEVMVHDRQTKATERASLASDGTWAGQGQGPGADSWQPAISGDGRYVAFRSDASNVVPEDTNNRPDVFVHDRQTGVTERASVASDGGQADGGSFTPAISADGRHVAFVSGASNLVPGSTNSAWDLLWDIFVHDRETGITERVSVASDGTQGNGDSYPPFAPGIRAPAMSADGRHVAFASDASNLVPDDTNGSTDIFVRDRGPVVGVGALSGVVEGDGLTVTGWATFSGQVVASADDPPDDGAPGAEEAGGELTGARLVYRHEQEDLLVRLLLTSLPDPAGDAPPPIRSLRSTVPSVLYGLQFGLGGAQFEVRALRVGATGAPPDAPYFAVHRCELVCEEVARLGGGIGTTGAEVRVAVPLAAVAASEGAMLTGVRAFTAVGEAAPGARVALDDVALPDASIPVSLVELGIAPADVPEEEVAFTTEATLVEGEFSGTVDVSSLVAGDYRLWARACLGEVCGARSVEVTP